MTPFTRISARAVLLPVQDVDTDQIIPARFLKVTDKQGLGDALFCDWRFRADGTPDPDFPLNRPQAQGARVLVAGANFGCGSSREHAPWALAGWGLRALVSTSFADIFRSNALKNGLLPVQLDAEAHGRLVQALREDPAATIDIDLAGQTVRLPDGTSAAFPIDPFAKHCLLNGIDELGYLLGFEKEIAAYERQAV